MARMTGKAEFSRLRGRLFASDSRDFERLASPLIRFIAPTAFGAPPLGSVDCAGVDILAWGTKNELLLAVQCKGFKVSEHEIGKDQVEQCQKSVDSFLKSGLRAKKYILLINRYGELAEFRPHVLRILGNLEATGQVDSAQLWDCNKLVSETAKSAKQRVINRIKAPSLNSISDPEIKNVPYKVSDCIIDRHGLKSVVEVSSYVSDPSQELLKIDKGVDSRLILLGEAGYGKTTLASRSNSINGCTFYVRASSLRSVLISKKRLYGAVCLSARNH